MSLPFQILDTFKVHNHLILYRELHIQRILRTILFLRTNHGFHADVKFEPLIRQQYMQIEANHLEPTKVRVVIDLMAFKIKFSTESIVENPPRIQLKFCQVGLQKSGLGIGNFKTTDRKYWEQNAYLIQTPNDDLIGENDKGEVTETSRFSIFVREGTTLFTPPLDSGCLAGVFREFLLHQKQVDLNHQFLNVLERSMSKNDLSANPVYVGNSVRGLLQASLTS